MLPIGIRELACDLDAGRAVVRVENFIEPCWRDLDQLPSQLDRRRRSQTQLRRMSDAIKLLTNGCVDLGPTMAVEIAPQTRMAIDVPTAIRIDYKFAIATGDDNRLDLIPQRMLREWVPNIPAVPLDEPLLISRMNRKISIHLHCKHVVRIGHLRYEYITRTVQPH